eukprot:gene1820-2154_t
MRRGGSGHRHLLEVAAAELFGRVRRRMAAELEAAQPAVVAAVAEASVQQGHGRRSAAQCFAGVWRLAAADAPLSLGSVRRMAAELEGGGSYNLLFPLNKAPSGLCEVV